MVKRSDVMSRSSRIVLLTDLHLRSDYLPGYMEEQMKTLVALVNRKPADAVVINGDIFHRRNPRGKELLAFRKLLEKFKTKDIYINRGNHDTVAKDGSTATTLSLYKDIAHVCEDVETVRICGVDFDFIPHFEDERVIVAHLKKAKNHVFGHFGFDGCVSNGHYAYESYVKKKHFPKEKYSFLGHIHKPKVYNSNIFVLGTQYSTNFGEANAQKFIHELIIRNGEMEIVRKPIDFGIRHVLCGVNELDTKSKEFMFGNFYTVLRIKLDHLDAGSEVFLRDEVFSKYKVAHVEVAFDDVLPKYSDNFIPQQDGISISDSIIEKYIDSSHTVFSKYDLLDCLSDIRDYENK